MSPSAVSIYHAPLAAYIAQEAAKAGVLPKEMKSEKDKLEREWMRNTLRQLPGGPTIKTGGVLVRDFVKFHDLNPKDPRCTAPIFERELGRLLSLDDFYEVFAVICHLNDKSADHDKICLPRQSRLAAIREELLNGGSNPPEGYAGQKASWKHEVKTGWMLIQVKELVYVGRIAKNGGFEGAAINLEQAYEIVARNHVQQSEKDGRVKHLSRDNTAKAIKNEMSSRFPKEIVEHFVAECPACKGDAKRAARKQGAMTTKQNGGNGQKSGGSKKRQSDSELDMDASPPTKRSRSRQPSKCNKDPVMTPPATQQSTSHNQYPAMSPPAVQQLASQNQFLGSSPPTNQQSASHNQYAAISPLAVQQSSPHNQFLAMNPPTNQQSSPHNQFLAINPPTNQQLASHNQLLAMSPTTNLQLASHNQYPAMSPPTNQQLASHSQFLALDPPASAPWPHSDLWSSPEAFKNQQPQSQLEPTPLLDYTDPNFDSTEEWFNDFIQMEPGINYEQNGELGGWAYQAHPLLSC